MYNPALVVDQFDIAIAYATGFELDHWDLPSCLDLVLGLYSNQRPLSCNGLLRRGLSVSRGPNTRLS